MDYIEVLYTVATFFAYSCIVAGVAGMVYVAFTYTED